jgi:threonine aldolase
MKIKKTFASDNNAGVHPEIMEAILRANIGHTVGYGDDEYTESAIRKLKEHFGDDIEVFFVFGGTGANVISLKTVTDSFNSVVCASTAHIVTDECGAPEKFTGCKLLTIPSEDGKITAEKVEQTIRGKGDQHHSQESVVSITQATERGTVYTQSDVKAIARVAHKHNLVLHMDGARICNAAAKLGISLKEATTDAGVDILSFGGTKNGLMYGEAVIFFNKKLAGNFKFFRKQGMQLASKMRFIAVQFEALLTNDLWLRNAEHSNKMALLLAQEVGNIPGVKIMNKIEANSIFAALPREVIPALQEEFYFYIFDDSVPIVRWMTSYDTTEDDVHAFADATRKAMSLHRAN